MKKIIVSMNITLDGFMSGVDCGLDWHLQSWTGEMAECLSEELSKADTILLGRITYDAMSKYWPAKAIDCSFPREDIAFADMMNSYKKIVFSKTLKNVKWNNSKLVKKNIAKEIFDLKKEPGKNIIVYGSGQLVSSLMQLNLVDEYQVWIHPVLLGKGKSLFNSHNYPQQKNMKLFKTKKFSSGVVMLCYECLS